MVTELAGHFRQEPGNVTFAVYTKAEASRAYWIYEVYRDEDAFQAHLAAPYGAPFNAQLRDLIEEDGSVLASDRAHMSWHPTATRTALSEVGRA